jgi:CheY-like chemotaxis protein
MRRKLLLADDSVTIQRVIELTFADEDVQVVAVGDGKKAIASIEADRPDIVLADVGMPERDGYEVAAFIKGDPRLASIPVLLLTGAFEPVDETRARAVGCDGVLVKPFEPQVVINRVKDLLAGRRPAGLWTASPTAQGPTRQAAASPFAAPALQPAPPGPGGSLEDYFDRLDAAFANLEGSAHDASAAPQAEPRAVEPVLPADAAGHAVASDPSWRPDVGATDSAGARGSSALPADVLDGWDPDLTGDPRRAEPVSAAAPPPVPRPAAQAPAPPPPAAAPVAPAPAAPATLSASEPAPPAPVQERVEAASASSTRAPSLAEAFAALLSAEQSRPMNPPAFRAPAAPDLSDAALEAIVQRVIARMGEQAVRETVVDVAERLVREEIARIKGA